MADCHTIGTDIIVQGTFETDAGVLVTPTTFTVTHRDPSGNTATIPQGSIITAATGVLEAAIPADEVGVWRYKWNVIVAGDDLIVTGHFCVCEDGVT